MISRIIYILCAGFLLFGCGAVPRIAESVSDFCPPSTDTPHRFFGSPDSDQLIIFIHGFCGDAKSTWVNPQTHFDFPQELAQDLANENQPAYVVSFDYVSNLRGGPSILSIADHLEFEIGELLKAYPYRTLRIVAHSMGGIIAREYILRRQPHSHPHLKITNVVLLATPNNGTELADLRGLIPENRQVEELRHIDKGNTYLESLNKDWNRAFKGEGHPRHVLLFAGYEELPLSLLGKVVQLSSAITFADDSIGFQRNHVSIAKPQNRDVVYRWVKAKLEERLESRVQFETISAADRERLNKAVAIIKEHEYKNTEAIKTLALPPLKELYENYPQEKLVLHPYGVALFETGQYRDAMEVFKHYVVLYPIDFKGHYHLGISKKQYSVALTKDNKPAGEINKLRWEAMGHLSDALKYYNEALEAEGYYWWRIARNTGWLYFQLSNRCENKRLCQKAIEWHQKALNGEGNYSGKRDYALALNNLGEIYSALGLFKDAECYFWKGVLAHQNLLNSQSDQDKAEAQKEENKFVYENLALFLLKQNRELDSFEILKGGEALFDFKSLDPDLVKLQSKLTPNGASARDLREMAKESVTKFCQGG